MYKTVLQFWFEEISSKEWWIKDPKFDGLIRERFLDLHTRVTQGEMFLWREHARGRLAEIIVLDQFSRNIYRDLPKAFASDSIALVLAQEAVSNKSDKELSQQERCFLYMPYMHSESSLIHQQAVELYTELGLETNLEYEMKHKVIIDRFGRYPHRNILLGRESTPEELEFLSQPGSSF